MSKYIYSGVYAMSMTPSAEIPQQPVSRAVRMEWAEVELQQAYLSGDDFSWKTEMVEKYLWMCPECRLVWKTQHDAEECKDRQTLGPDGRWTPTPHAASFVRGYGGRVENRRYLPAAKYMFHAVRREPTKSKQASA
jgi:hypothetical protein